MPSEQIEARLGQRHESSWALKAGWLYDEKSGRVYQGHLPSQATTPKVPSLKAAVQGIQDSYGGRLVMGTDPEFFLTRDGQMVPAFDHLPDKHATHDGLFWDGFQAETLVDVRGCNEPGCNCKGAEFTCHDLLAHRIGRQVQLLAPKGLNIAPRSVWRIPPQMLELASAAQVGLGCEPSYNVYHTHARCVEEPRLLPYRFAGGHVHFQLTRAERDDASNIRYLVKTLDALLGIPSVCLAQNYDHFIRRRYYGLAGEHRLPPHGLEYRTLSNFWMMDPKAMQLIFDLAGHVLFVGQARLRNVFVGASNERAIRDTINFSDVRSAKDFMRLNKEFYSAWAHATYYSDKAFWEAIQGGLDKVVPNWGRDVVQAWSFGHWYNVPRWSHIR